MIDKGKNSYMIQNNEIFEKMMNIEIIDEPMKKYSPKYLNQQINCK